jgi:benzil reductase ((S)-benzoin forming)
MTSQHLTIITGASRGMGLAMAELRLDAGHRLLCISRQANAALASRASPSANTAEQWTQDLSQTQEAAARLGAWLGELNGDEFASVTLINNAGVLPQIAPLGDIASADLALALRVDLEAPMLLTGCLFARHGRLACSAQGAQYFVWPGAPGHGLAGSLLRRQGGHGFVLKLCGT